MVADFNTGCSCINSDAHIFPNPVTQIEFKVLFDGQKQAGKYNVTITDLSGKAL